MTSVHYAGRGIYGPLAPFVMKILCATQRNTSSWRIRQNFGGVRPAALASRNIPYLLTTHNISMHWETVAPDGAERKILRIRSVPKL